ncbi:MAG: hypothetical protein ACETVY_04600 [Candidatus Bathyarchaeia archaeon]
MSKVVDLNLTKNERDRAAELQEKAIVTNTLTGCHGWQFMWRQFRRRRAYNLIEKGLEGGCTRRARSSATTTVSTTRTTRPGSRRTPRATLGGNTLSSTATSSACTA